VEAGACLEHGQGALDARLLAWRCARRSPGPICCQRLGTRST
jgi:hypothetical protein